jgi:hypothetical protein
MVHCICGQQKPLREMIVKDKERAGKQQKDQTYFWEYSANQQ